MTERQSIGGRWANDQLGGRGCMSERSHVGFQYDATGWHKSAR